MDFFFGGGPFFRVATVVEEFIEEFEEEIAEVGDFLDALLEARGRVQHFFRIRQFQRAEDEGLGVEGAGPVFVGAGHEEFGAAQFFPAEQGGLGFGTDGGQPFADGDFVGAVAGAGEEQGAFDGHAEFAGIFRVEDSATRFRGEP